MAGKTTISLGRSILPRLKKLFNLIAIRLHNLIQLCIMYMLCHIYS